MINITDEEVRAMDRARIARLEEQKRQAEYTIQQIEGGMTFWEALGGEPMREVTAERLSEKTREIELLDQLIAVVKEEV